MAIETVFPDFTPLLFSFCPPRAPPYPKTASEMTSDLPIARISGPVSVFKSIVQG